MEVTLDQKVFKIVATHFGVRETDLTLSTKFIDDLDGDSLDVVELILEIEDQFDIEVTEEQAEELYNVGLLIDFLKNLKHTSLS